MCVYIIIVILYKVVYTCGHMKQYIHTLWYSLAQIKGCFILIIHLKWALYQIFYKYAVFLIVVLEAINVF